MRLQLFVALCATAVASTASAQECVTCWQPRCGDAMKSYLAPCGKEKPSADQKKQPVSRRRSGARHSRTGKSKVDRKTGLELSWIPGGTFTMGCIAGDTLCNDDEKPPHRERLAGFWLTTTEVTVEAYEKCVRDGSCSIPDSDPETCNWTRRWSHPVNCVDWSQAQAFCEWMGGRLPSAAEWEYAAKGGSEGRRFPWGNEAPRDSSANFEGSGTTPAGTYPDQASRWGPLDLAGNVAEWTDSHYDASTREVRGGGWDDASTSLRTSARGQFAESYRGDALGFRCAK